MLELFTNWNRRFRNHGKGVRERERKGRGCSCGQFGGKETILFSTPR
jgi:hypothetical protein